MGNIVARVRTLALALGAPGLFLISFLDSSVLTFPVINRARKILWVVTGGEKAAMLARLRAGDLSIPAGRIRPENAVVIADRAAAGEQPRRT